VVMWIVVFLRAEKGRAHDDGVGTRGESPLQARRAVDHRRCGV
jgi:hypothetical protein